MKLCTPAFIYFILSIITIMMMIAEGVFAFSLIIKIMFVILWTWMLHFLCSKGLEVISWILVLLPFILVLGIVAGAYETIARNQIPSLSPSS